MPYTSYTTFRSGSCVCVSYIHLCASYKLHCCIRILGKAINTCCSQDGFPTIYAAILGGGGKKRSNSVDSAHSTASDLFVGFDKSNIVEDVRTADTYNVTKQGSSIAKKKRVMKAANTKPNKKPRGDAKVLKRPAAGKCEEGVKDKGLKMPAALISEAMIEAAM